MGYNQENYRRIREKYRSKYLDAYAEADRRMREVHEKSPELEEIDRRLSMTGAEIALASIGTGEGYREKLAAVQEKNLQLQARRAALLLDLGYPADYTKPPYECAKCKDSGFVGTKMCDCMRRELVAAGMASSGLGALIERQSFENFDLSLSEPETLESKRINFEFAKRYAEGFDEKSGNLLFVGGTGLGKTHLSTAIAKTVISRGYDVYYTTAVSMIEDFEAGRFGHGERATDDPQRYLSCDLLILDDLGTEVVNQFTISCIYTVINERINRNLSTLINTNLSQKELRARYTDRIFSRLIGEYRVVLFSGTDVRLLKLKKGLND